MLRVADNPQPRWPRDRSLADDLGRWRVLVVKPRNEKALAWDLARMGVSYFLPLITKRTIRRDTGKPRKSVISLFPGYLSTAGWEDRRTEILRTGRVLRAIAVVDQSRFVEQMENVRQALELSRNVGVHPGLAVGQKMMIVSGPFQGLSGVVTRIDQPDRIYLNVDMFNRAVSVALSSMDELAPLDDRISLKIANA
jgi:transcription antitermination factor NusG